MTRRWSRAPPSTPATCMAAAGTGGVGGRSLVNRAPLAWEVGAAGVAIALGRRQRRGRRPLANKRLAEVANGGRKITELEKLAKRRKLRRLL